MICTERVCHAGLADSSRVMIAEVQHLEVSYEWYGSEEGDNPSSDFRSHLGSGALRRVTRAR
jgi:hypothetical protein